jgi:hypothetical protein
MRASVLTIALGTVLLGQPMVPRVVAPGEAVGAEFWEGAPAICAIEVRSAGWAQPRQVARTFGRRLRLVVVRARVEHCLTSDYAGAIEFRYFATAAWQKDSLWFSAGERAIIFMMQEGSSLRLISDFSGLKIPLKGSARTGDHGAGTAIWSAIADTVLRPQIGEELQFAADLSNKLAILDSYAPRAAIIPMLELLIESRHQQIRAETCLFVARRFLYTDRCLGGSVDWDDEDLRSRAAGLMRNRMSSVQFAEYLGNHPLEAMKARSSEDVASQLRLFTRDTSNLVQSTACEVAGRLGVGCRTGRE